MDRAAVAGAMKAPARPEVKRWAVGGLGGAALARTVRRSEVLDAHRKRTFEIHETCSLANDDERSPTTRRLEIGAVAEIVVRIRTAMNSGKDQYPH